MKWFILMCGLGGDLLLLAALLYGFLVVPSLTFILSIPVYFAWKSVGGLSNWRLSTIRSFLRNWEIVMSDDKGNTTND